MTKAEIKELIEEKENKIDKYESILYFNFKTLTIFSVIAFIICIVVGIIMIAIFFNLDNMIFISGSSFAFVFATIILIIYVLCLIYYLTNKRKAPSEIEKLEKEIEILKLGLDK